jgi:hypothetical protein
VAGRLSDSQRVAVWVANLPDVADQLVPLFMLGADAEAVCFPGWGSRPNDKLRDLLKGDLVGPINPTLSILHDLYSPLTRELQDRGSVWIALHS